MSLQVCQNPLAIVTAKSTKTSTRFLSKFFNAVFKPSSIKSLTNCMMAFMIFTGSCIAALTTLERRPGAAEVAAEVAAVVAVEATPFSAVDSIALPTPSSAAPSMAPAKRLAPAVAAIPAIIEQI